SRKVHKSAVVRNRIRRRIYECIRHCQPNITGPYDVIVTVYQESIATLPAEQLEAVVRGLLQRAGIVSDQANTGPHAIVKEKE
ncbi:MAG TPA: ribonuclease P protein component, partial [Candidatus Limnocylindrales bacterium]|nr:ribonuclease P protein component [Candidatus Limnocylindrales bacterium]